MISRDKDNPAVRYMFPVKSSLAPEGSAVAFSLNAHNGFSWLGKKEIDKSLLNDCYIDENKTSLAIRIIQEVLEEGDVSSADIVHKLKLMDVSERTIQSAKKKLGVKSYRQNGAWYWRLPNGNDYYNGWEDI